MVADESPFHRLDVSFHSVEEHLTGYHKVPRTEGCGEMRVVHERNTYPELDDSSLPPFPKLSISARETEIGRLANSLKAHLRGEDRSAKVTIRAAELRASLGELTRESRMEGGRIGELAYQVLEIARSASPAGPEQQG